MAPANVSREGAADTSGLLSEHKRMCRVIRSRVVYHDLAEGSGKSGAERHDPARLMAQDKVVDCQRLIGQRNGELGIVERRARDPVGSGIPIFDDECWLEGHPAPEFGGVVGSTVVDRRCGVTLATRIVHLSAMDRQLGKELAQWARIVLHHEFSLAPIAEILIPDFD